MFSVKRLLSFSRVQRRNNGEYVIVLISHWPCAVINRTFQTHEEPQNRALHPHCHVLLC